MHRKPGVAMYLAAVCLVALLVGCGGKDSEPISPPADVTYEPEAEEAREEGGTTFQPQEAGDATEEPFDSSLTTESPTDNG